MSDKSKNRELHDLLTELSERLDAVDEELRPELPEADYGVTELSAATLVKLTIAKAQAFLDAAEQAREAGAEGEELLRRISIVAGNEVTDLIPDDVIPDDVKAVLGIDGDGADEIDEALLKIEGPVI